MLVSYCCLAGLTTDVDLSEHVPYLSSALRDYETKTPMADVNWALVTRTNRVLPYCSQCLSYLTTCTRGVSSFDLYIF